MAHIILSILVYSVVGLMALITLHDLWRTLMDFPLAVRIVLGLCVIVVEFVFVAMMSGLWYAIGGIALIGTFHFALLPALLPRSSH